MCCTFRFIGCVVKQVVADESNAQRKIREYAQCTSSMQSSMDLQKSTLLIWQSAPVSNKPCACIRFYRKWRTRHIQRAHCSRPCTTERCNDMFLFMARARIRTSSTTQFIALLRRAEAQTSMRARGTASSIKFHCQSFTRDRRRYVALTPRTWIESVCRLWNRRGVELRIGHEFRETCCNVRLIGARAFHHKRKRAATLYFVHANEVTSRIQWRAGRKQALCV